MPLALSIRQAFEEETNYDYILLCVKAYHAEEALNELLAFNPSPPPIITVQNGIGIEEMYVSELGAELVTAASLTTPLRQETYQTIIVERRDRGLALAPAAMGTDISGLVQLFHESGIDTEGLDDYRSMKWSKALLNMVGNATSAILNRHPRVIYNYKPTFQIEMEMLKEAITIIRRQGLKPINLPGAEAARLAFATRWLPSSIVKPILSGIVASGRGNKMPSFHVDLASGRERNEVTFHNGAVARAGDDLGVSTPVNTALNNILTGLARRQISYDEYDGKPDRLVEEVERYRERAKEGA